MSEHERGLQRNWTCIHRKACFRHVLFHASTYAAAHVWCDCSQCPHYERGSINALPLEKGPGITCRNDGCYMDSTRFKCSECGYNGWVKWAADGKDRVPSFCPNCGRKVVSDEQD